MKLLYAEDEISMSEAVKDILEYHNYSVDAVYDGEEALEFARLEHYDGIILDVMMPKLNGLQVLQKLRAEGCKTPVLLLTAKSEVEDRIEGLDMGADDYLVKPFGMMEMVSRVRAVLRRTEPQRTQKTLRAGKLTLNLDTYVVQVDGERVQLTLKEYKLLRIFMENPGRVFTRERLLEMVWEVDYIGETRTVDVHIGTLRTKLGDCADYIKTVRGVGYCMEVPA